MKWRWLLALIPLALGLVSAILLNETGLPNPTYQVLISLSTLLLFLGIFLSLVLLVGLLARGRAERRHEQEITQLQTKMAADRRRFLQRLDHELKNPLMAIRAGLANFANAPTDEARRAALATVDAQTVRLSRLTTDLRKIAELESRPLERSTVDLQELLVEAVEANQNKTEADDQQETGACRISLVLPQAPWPLPTVAADWDLIYLAVYNLLDNAQKFSQPGCAIEVRGREEGQFVVVEVADTGPGIAADDRQHVWEELYRGQSGRTVEGSGLGLALVKAIIERHGGSAAIDSKLDQGTVVTLRLPKAGPPG